jgi:NADPH:quinone reductase-like Zn-dependent oxidoreductase
VGTGRGRDRAATPAGGAQQFADLDSERFEEVAGQVDVVLDTIGGEVLDRSAAVVRPGGMLVSVALPPKIRPAGGRAMYFVVEPNGGELAELARRVQQGRLAPPAGAVRPLAETREAFLGKQGTPARPSYRSSDRPGTRWLLLTFPGRTCQCAPAPRNCHRS